MLQTSLLQNITFDNVDVAKKYNSVGLRLLKRVAIL